MGTPELELTIRYAGASDEAAVARLAELDGACLPRRDVLVAEVGGTIVAALALGDGEVAADPFQRTRGAVDLLRLRAEQLARPNGRSRWPRLLRRTLPV